MKSRTILALSLSMALVACSGNVGSDSTTLLVTSDESTANVKIVPAFPALQFDASVFLTAVPQSNKLAVIEQAGRIRVFDNADNVSVINTALDISDRITFGGEQGLLGMAFDPKFANNGYVYINYSMSAPRRNVISRMQWDTSTNQVNSASEKIIIEIKQPYSNHNGGMLAFGPDNYLYIGVGDGGSGGDPLGHGQNRTTLLGNLLRLDVHPGDESVPYAIPQNNPFANDACCRPEIYSFGWRNPYRFSFDRETGVLWAPGVGQNAIEEINVVKAGGNYGWKTYEGTRQFKREKPDATKIYQSPVYEYDHSQGRSITGGYVYRGSVIPALQGRYLYADYVSGTVWALASDGEVVVSNNELGTVRNPTSFGESASGDVFIVSHNNGIYRFE